MHISTRVKAYLSLIAVAIIWGAASVVIKGTMEYLRPMEFLYYRFTLLLPIIIPWYIYELKKNPIRWRDIVPLTIFGLMATTVYLSMIFWGFARTTAIDGNLLGTLNPLFIIILGVLFLKEKVTNREKIGFIITFIGVIITIIQPFLEGAAFALKNTWGNTIIVSATIVWALFVLLSKKNAKHYSPILITLHSGIVAALTYPILAYVENSYVLPDITTLLSHQPALWGVLYMALPSYVLAYILYEYGMSKIEISEGSLFTYLQPLFATPLAVVFLGEAVTLPFIIGAVIIFTGVVLSEWKW